MLPRVEELSERFPNELVVVGVHSGKFRTERLTDRIRHACDRLGVTHPVVNDRSYRIWRSYSVSAWPTVALLDPQGYVIGMQSGEFDTNALADMLGEMIDDYRGDLPGEPFDSGDDPVSMPKPSGPLSYPTRVIERDGFLYVSDSGHRRVIEVKLETPEAGRVVRSFAGATGVRFQEPQGLALLGGDLFLADRRGQSVWRIELEGGRTERVAGTGNLGSGYLTAGSSDTDLRSPWGLAAHETELLVTMAGSHTIWRLDPQERLIEPVAGSGAEEIRDGVAARAALAQPTGVNVHDTTAYFADSESSAVRRLDLADGLVDTIVGTGLFDFGDRDGRGDSVRLQHCLDLALKGDDVIIADTYNDKIKVVDPVRRTSVPYPGPAGSGSALYEPGGISVAGSSVYVADTGNHRIVSIDDTGRLQEIRIAEEGRERS